MNKTYTRRKLDKIVVRQHDQSDCGVAALRTVIAWHGGTAKAEDLRILSGTSVTGTTMLGLYQAAQECGLDTQGVEMDMEHLRKQQDPCILHTLIDDQYEHYVVYLGEATNGDLLLGDPAKGVVSIRPAELEEVWKSKAALMMKPSDTFQYAKQLRLDKWNWFIQHLQEDYPLLGISIFLGLLVAVMSLSTAIFTQKLIDDMLPSGNQQRIYLGVAFLFVLLIGRSGLIYIRQHMVLLQSRLYNERITGSFLDRLLHLPKPFFDSRKSGDMIARLNDTQRIQRNISYITGNVIVDALLVAASLVFLFIYSWQVALLACAAIPVIAFTVWYYSKPIEKGQTAVMSAYGQTESHYIDTIQGVSTIKENNAESFFSSITKKAFSGFQGNLFDLGKTGNRFGLASEFIGAVLTVALIALSTILVLQGDLQLGQMIAVISITSTLLPAVGRISQINLQVQEAKIAFDRMYDFIGAKKEVSSEEMLQEAPPFKSLALNQISFRFNGRKTLLHGIDLQVKKGEFVALLGESGGGKSTLLQLIQKFYLPSQGQVLVNGQNLSEIDPRSWRQQIATVPQDVKIFSGSLYYNVVLDKISSEQHLQHFHQFCMDYGFAQYFAQLPQGYLTPVGEDGINLSGGQKQLVALARALYKRPALLLLDEATAAMDKKTESFVLLLLQRLKADMGILMVTHRYRAARPADKVYLIESGKAALAGDFGNLLHHEVTIALD